jgi:transcription elongation factor GreA
LKLGKISVTSPIGQGLMGKLVGQIAEVKAPNGLMRFQIEHIGI